MRMTFLRGGDSPPSVPQTSHRLLHEALRDVLRAVVQGGPGAANGIGSVPGRAVAALYQVLRNHPIDRRGRCRSCRRPGAVFGRRYRRCRVHVDAEFWLHQPDAGLLLDQLASEVNQQPETPARTFLPKLRPPRRRPTPAVFSAGGRTLITAGAGSRTRNAPVPAVAHPDLPAGCLVPAGHLPGRCLDRPLPDDHCPDQRPVGAIGYCPCEAMTITAA